MPLEEQTQPCPKCGAWAGWWSPIQRNLSMVFHDRYGEITESRIVESKRKQCAACDADVTECVSGSPVGG